MGRDPVDAPQAVLTEEFVAACRELGRARVIVRNSLGLAEGFVDLRDIAIEDGWLNLCCDRFHIHLVTSAICAVRLNDAVPNEAGRPARSISFFGGGGCALVVIALDQTTGEDEALQDALFDELRTRFGRSCALVAGEELANRAPLH